MNKDTRNKLRGIIVQCRTLLERAVSEVLQGEFGIHTTGLVESSERMVHLSSEDHRYREQILTHLEHIKSFGLKPKNAIDQLIREASFTHLNRLCAYKMMERRRLIKETVSHGLKSKGFIFYLSDHPEEEELWSGGKQELAYKHFLESLGETLSAEIGVLFSQDDLANRLFPPFRALEKVLSLINSPELEDVWVGSKEDEGKEEVIGWVYQYFTPKELRDAARDPKRGGSQAPRNSYELAFRNQFYTPRYVVQFLADNTLGRIWYEMRQGETVLREQCRYLVRRPHEVFLSPGEEVPDDGLTGGNLTEDEMKRPIYVRYRAKKDPREIRVLDPACGSGHFLLYCFDLLQVIYEEAYEDNELGGLLKRDYRTLDDLRKAVPRLILANNLYGIDIDLRATQIAGLALWLRCQRAYQELELKTERPPITRTNVVCAEPMPGETELLEEFLKEIYPPFLSAVVRAVFEKMKLAGEAGSLLKIEEEITGSITEAKKHWRSIPQQQQFALFRKEKLSDGNQGELFDLSGITDEQFWEEAEARVLESLQHYSQRVANNGHGLLRRLFVDDAEQGFAFVDICSKRFDVVLMNPPFGEASKPSKEYIELAYPKTKNDVYAAFVERGIDKLNQDGLLGAITSRTGFFLSSFEKWREHVLQKCALIDCIVDLGAGVLDAAMVETAAFTVSRTPNATIRAYKLDDLTADDREAALKKLVSNTDVTDRIYDIAVADIQRLPGYRLLYWVPTDIRNTFSAYRSLRSLGFLACVGLQTNDDFRFVRASWEVPRNQIGRQLDWCTFFKGGDYSPYFDDIHLVVNWRDDGFDIKQYTISLGNSPSRHVVNENYYFHSGLAYTNISSIGFSLQPMPAETIFSIQGQYLGGQESLPPFGLLSSSTVGALLDIINPGRHYQAGQVQLLPVPDHKQQSDLDQIAYQIVETKRKQATYCEESRIFQLPVAFSTNGTVREKSENAFLKLHQDRENIRRLICKIDKQAMGIFGLGELASGYVSREMREVRDNRGNFFISSIADKMNSEEGFSRWLTDSLLSYFVGCVLGRWDVRYATGEQPASSLPGLFAALPVYAPGSLVDEEGLPLQKSPRGYPLHVVWEGILVDDPDHDEDITRCVRSVFELLWPDRAEDIEREACEILGVNELADYFRKSSAGGFWADHLKRYSKSRRKAPIYWLLQSEKKNYAVWLYYHRLDRDILYKTLQQVGQKIKHKETVVKDMIRLHQEGGTTGASAKQLERKIETQKALLSEIENFRDKLKRAADLNLEPNLNDGVVLNIAPLWELVPWAEPKKYWEELLEGKYDWSSIGKQLRDRGLVTQ